MFSRRIQGFVELFLGDPGRYHEFTVQSFEQKDVVLVELKLDYELHEKSLTMPDPFWQMVAKSPFLEPVNQQFMKLMQFVEFNLDDIWVDDWLKKHNTSVKVSTPIEAGVRKLRRAGQGGIMTSCHAPSCVSSSSPVTSSPKSTITSPSIVLEFLQSSQPIHQPMQSPPRRTK
jgi:hypothetical protein